LLPGKEKTLPSDMIAAGVFMDTFVIQTGIRRSFASLRMTNSRNVPVPTAAGMTARAWVDGHLG